MIQWYIDLGNKKFMIGWPWKYELDVPRQHIQDNGWIVCLGLNNSRQERRVFRKQQRNHKCGSYHLQSMIDVSIMINGDRSMFLNWSYIWKALSLLLSSNFPKKFQRKIKLDACQLFDFIQGQENFPHFKWN